MADFDISDHEYGPEGGPTLLARVYRPAGAGPFPAVVDVHGGAWTSGDRGMNTAIDSWLAANGILVAALDFRTDAPYPASIADINLGIRWLKANAEQFGTRADLVGGLGTSSGGHQILLCALRPDHAAYGTHALPGGPDASLPWVVACWPVADPLARLRMAQGRNQENLLRAHAAFWPDEAAMEDASPTLIVDRGEVANPPPLLVIQGGADDNLPPDNAHRLVAAWRKAGGAAEMFHYAGQIHGFIGKDVNAPDAADALGRIAGFIHARAGLTVQPTPN